MLIVFNNHKASCDKFICGMFADKVVKLDENSSKGTSFVSVVI